MTHKCSGIIRHEPTGQWGKAGINGNFQDNNREGAAYNIPMRDSVVIAGPGWQDAEHISVLRDVLLAAGFVEQGRNVQRWAWTRSVPDTPLVHELSFEGYVQGKAWIADGVWVKACTVARSDRSGRRILGPALNSIDSSFTTNGISHVAHILQGFRRNEQLWRQGGAIEPAVD